jgi:hypothetical protein
MTLVTAGSRWGIKLMETVLYVIGFLLVYAAIMMRLQRREDYQTDLENAEYENKTELFWGMSTEGEDQRIKEIREQGYGTRMERFKFAAQNWSMAIIGGLILLFLWINRETPKEPWKSDITNVFLFAGILGSYSYYQFLRIIHRLERHIGWLEQMLRAVNSHSESMRKGSIDEYIQLRARLDSLSEK